MVLTDLPGYAGWKRCCASGCDTDEFGQGNPQRRSDPGAGGQEAGAAVVLGVASATGVADVMEALGEGDPELEPPQAATLAMTTTAASAIRHELSIQRFTAAMPLAAERVVRFPST